MQHDYPRFTVIIPLKDREEYIGATLRTCMIQNYPNFEVIVSDDCSADNSAIIAEELSKQDNRIKVFAHKKHLGMRENFEFALNQVKPGYVMALGGDDGLTPGCITRMHEILSETGKKLLTWPPAQFIYPDDSTQGHSFLSVHRAKSKKIRIIKSKEFLQKISKTFQYQIDECPMFYMKGVASTELVNRVKSRTPDGSFYYCPTPDGFSGVVLAGEVEDYAFTEEPLSMGGTTNKSQGQNYRRTDEKSKLEAKQFFDDNARRTMHRDLASQPYSPLVTLMTADYLLTAADLPNWPGKSYEVSIELLLRQTFKFLSKSFFDSQVLPRELRILKEIAHQHNLDSLFEQLYNNSYKCEEPGKNIYGFAITNSIRFDGKDLGIKDIFDACLPVNFIFRAYSSISVKAFMRFIKREYAVIKRYKFSRPKLRKISEVQF